MDVSFTETGAQPTVVATGEKPKQNPTFVLGGQEDPLETFKRAEEIRVLAQVFDHGVRSYLQTLTNPIVLYPDKFLSDNQHNLDLLFVSIISRAKAAGKNAETVLTNHMQKEITRLQQEKPGIEPYLVKVQKIFSEAAQQSLNYAVLYAQVDNYFQQAASVIVEPITLPSRYLADIEEAIRREAINGKQATKLNDLIQGRTAQSHTVKSRFATVQRVNAIRTGKQ